MIERKEIFCPSSDGIHTLAGQIFLPETPPRGIFQMVHGMTDYTQRYDTLLAFLAEAGYIAFGYDQLGHGKTVRDKTELGTFAEKDGWRCLVEDVRIFSDHVRSLYGEHLPYYLAGHSMGSFVVRAAVMKEIHPTKLILIGSAGPEITAPFGQILAKGIGKVYGKKHVSFFMQSMVFGNFDDRFPEKHPNRWITVDPENLIKYKDDPLCTFRFSVGAIEDLITLHRLANSPAFFRSVPDDMPILLLSGQDDPVGDFGKGVDQVYRRLKKKGKSASLSLYPGFRHEILQDFCRDQVMADILSFIE